MKNFKNSINEKVHKISNLNQTIILNIPIVKAAWNDLVSILDESSEELDSIKIAGMPFETAKRVVPELIEGIGNSSSNMKNTVMRLRTSVKIEEGD